MESLPPLPPMPPQCAEVAARRDVIGGGEGFAGEAVKDGEELGAFVDAAIGADPIGLGVADDFALAVHGAVGGFAADLGSAVAVEIVDHELRVVGAFADVLAEVDAPEHGAVELVSLQNGRIGRPVLRVILASAGHVDDDFVFAVAVEIAHGAVVDRVTGGRFHGHFNILPDRRVGGNLVEERLAHFLFDAADDGPDEVSVGLGRIDAGIDIIGGIGDGGGVDLDRRAVAGGAVEIESDVVRIGAEHAPADEDFPVSLIQGDDASAQIFHLPRRGLGSGRLRAACRLGQ